MQKQQTATNAAGQTVELGRPHEKLPSEHKKDAMPEIDMNPGEPARPFVGGEEPAAAKKARPSKGR